MIAFILWKITGRSLFINVASVMSRPTIASCFVIVISHPFVVLVEFILTNMAAF